MQQNKVPLRHQLTIARARRDFERVEALGQTILGRKNDPRVHRTLARLSDELRRPREALAHWQAVHLAEPGDFEAAYHCLVPCAGDAAELAARLGAIGRGVSTAFAENLALALFAMRAQPEPPPCRHIAICGVSFSGSTLLDRILGGLPGVASIGESHWLVKERHGPGDATLIDYSQAAPPEATPRCTVCGSACRVLDPGFRRELAATRTGWYQRIAARLGAGVLVSADKNVPKILDNDPLLRLDGLVLFKSPAQAWASHRAKLPTGLTDDEYAIECAHYGAVWTNAYRVLMREFAPVGRLHFLSFDAFASEPMRYLEAVCVSLDLPFGPDILEIRQRGHPIGGNINAMQRLDDTDYRAVITPLPDPGLSAREGAILTEVDGLSETLRELESRFAASVGRRARPAGP
jgi:hypothetical protein